MGPKDPTQQVLGTTNDKVGYTHCVESNLLRGMIAFEQGGASGDLDAMSTPAGAGMRVGRLFAAIHGPSTVQ